MANTTIAVNDKLDEFCLSAKKVELSAFDGFDPVAWITRAETYFEVQWTSEEVRIQLAKLSMEGHTIHWFNLWRESTDKATWTNFKEVLVARFGVGRLDNPYEELKEMKQMVLWRTISQSLNFILPNVDDFLSCNSWAILLEGFDRTSGVEFEPLNRRTRH